MLLTVIVPVSRMAGRLENLREWLQNVPTGSLEVVLIHDVQDEQTAIELSDLSSLAIKIPIRLISGQFGGPGEARNQGLKELRTKWFAFWDSDDFPRLQDFLEMVSTADKLGKNLAIGQFLIRDARTQNITRYSRTQNDLHRAIARNPGIWRMAFRTSIYQMNRFPNFKMGEDICWLQGVNFQQSETFISSKIVYEYVTGNSFQLTSGRELHHEILKTINYLDEQSQSKNGTSLEFLDFCTLRLQLSLMKRGPLKTRLNALRKILNKCAIKLNMRSIFFVLTLMFRNIDLKKPINVIMAGGLGNQLFQLNGAMHFTKNELVTLVYYSRIFKGEESQENFNPNTNRNISIVFKEISFLKHKVVNLGLRLSSRDYGPQDRFRNLNVLLIWITEFLFNVVTPGTKLRIARGKGKINFRNTSDESNFTYIGYFQSYALLKVENVNLSLLTMRKSFEESVYREAAAIAKEKNVLIVQVRLGDYAKNPHFGKLGSEYFSQGITRATTSGLVEEIWLFSDEIEAARALIKNPTNITLKEMSFDAANPSEILRIMSLGKTFVISNSTFGWWAARLAQSRDAEIQVYYPQPWFKDITSPDELCPASWTPIASNFS